MQRLAEIRQRLWQNWLNRRIPLTRQLSLSHRSIFIVPTKAGLLFIALLVVMLLTGINYQNSLIFALVFWLFSLSLVAMLLTFRNLAGLRIRAGQAQANFAGERVALPLTLAGNKRAHEAIYLGLPDQQGIYSQVLANDERELSLYYRPTKRGRLRVERILIESRFPFGLFRAWSWVHLEFHGIVYPKPEPTTMVLGQLGDEQQNEAGSQHSGDQEFHGLRHYQAGDSLKRIAWKQLARGKGLVTKEFNELLAGEYFFRWQDLAGLPEETRLSRLCAWLVQAHDEGSHYGLELPNQTFALNHSEQHLAQCLTALALFNLGEGEHA